MIALVYLKGQIGGTIGASIWGGGAGRRLFVVADSARSDA